MKTISSGNFFEDFSVGQKIVHATPRTVTSGDVALYQGLYGSRFALQSADTIAQVMGYERSPIDDLLTFHIVFGKTVPDISLNAVANLGYADCRFLKPVFVGDTLRAETEIIGLKENSNGQTGVVYVRSRGFDQTGTEVLTFIRWVMVRKSDVEAPTPEPIVPDLPEMVAPSALALDAIPKRISEIDPGLTGSAAFWGDYEVGDRIDHIDGFTLEEAEHQVATRLYQNMAKVHFNQHAANDGRFKRRLVYGGVIISMARAISFNGLGNVFQIAAINSGQHVAPAFAGDTVYAWSEILDKQRLAQRDDLGVLRVRLVATKDRGCAGFPRRDDTGKPEEGVILEFDFWGLVAL